MEKVNMSSSDTNKHNFLLAHFSMKWIKILSICNVVSMLVYYMYFPVSKLFPLSYGNVIHPSK
jgi:hypothetical protein